MRKYLIIISSVLLCACGPRGGKPASDAPARRDFPQVEVPSMYTDPQERAAYAAGHFWDRFADTAKVYVCDSATVNGVPLAAVESQMGLFATLLGDLPADTTPTPRSATRTCISISWTGWASRTSSTTATGWAMNGTPGCAV